MHISFRRGGRGGGGAVQAVVAAENFGSPKVRHLVDSQLKKILLPSARHLEEGRGTTILELPRLENYISRLCPRPLGSQPPPKKNPNCEKNT